MSGKNRRDVLAQNNPFSSTEETKAVTFEQTDSELFGKIAERDDAKLVAPSVPIIEIYPNPMQPRRALPSTIRALWDSDPQTLGAVFDAWEEKVNEERQEKGNRERFDVERLLLVEGREDTPENEESRTTPLEKTFLEIIRLAASIHRDGLLNPISAAYLRVEKVYLLETGERRWLAYHLLASKFPKEKQWKRIPTRTVEHVSVWRQASENTARQDLNAIGKARQFSVLTMDLVEKEKGTEFQPFDHFDSERGYYAQVLSVESVPYGKRDVLLNAMGLKSPAELSRCRDLLSLPDSVWFLADDKSVPQSTLLECKGKSEEEAYQIVSSWNDSDANGKKNSHKGLRKPASGLKQAFSFVMRADKGKVIPDKATYVFDHIDTLRQWLDEVEAKWQRGKGK